MGLEEAPGAAGHRRQRNSVYAAVLSGGAEGEAPFILGRRGSGAFALSPPPLRRNNRSIRCWACAQFQHGNWLWISANFSAQDFKLKPAMLGLGKLPLRFDERRAQCFESLAVPGIKAGIVQLRLAVRNLLFERLDPARQRFKRMFLVKAQPALRLRLCVIRGLLPCLAALRPCRLLGARGEGRAPSLQRSCPTSRPHTRSSARRLPAQRWK